MGFSIGVGEGSEVGVSVGLGVAVGGILDAVGGRRVEVDGRGVFAEVPAIGTEV